MKGVPLRLEIGPKDLESDRCVLVRRDNGEKTFAVLDGLEGEIEKRLGLVQKALYDKAKKNLDGNIFPARSPEEAREIIGARGGGFIKTMWCGGADCETRMKEIAGVSSRCLPLEQERLGDACHICGKPARKSVIWGIAY
jgi:prolyl-tRNA synthetase